LGGGITKGCHDSYNATRGDTTRIRDHERKGKVNFRENTMPCRSEVRGPFKRRENLT